MFKKISFKVAVLVNTVLLVVVSTGTFLLVNKQSARLEEDQKEQARFITAIGARAVGRIMEEAIDNGALSVKDLFDTEYIPVPGTDPAKYHTRYDGYLDKAILSLQDEMLKKQNLVYAVSVDSNGYLPTHNSKFQQAITGDKEKDKAGNRSKRIFNDPVGLTAAKNTQNGLIQVYKRDTGETMWDVSTPIIVKGKQWGNFRIGLSPVSLQQIKTELIIQLTGIMFVILIVSAAAIIFTVKKLLHPLTELTVLASKMADGAVEKKIIATSRDEIGELAEVLERMRISLKAAMERLMRK